MTEQTQVEAYLHAEWSQYYEKYTFSVYSCDMSGFGYIPLQKISIPIPVFTETELKSRHLILLRIERQKVYDEARNKAAELDEQIAKLEAIGHTPTPTTT